MVERAVAALRVFGRVLMSRTSPRLRVRGTESKSREAPLREGRFWRRSKRVGVRNRRKRKVGRFLSAKMSGCGVP